MANIEVTVPDLGVEDAVEVIEICVEVGQSIAEEEPVIVLESDKATMEIPSSSAGTVSEILISVGDKLSQGDRILVLDGEGDSASSGDDKQKDADEERSEQDQEEQESEPEKTEDEASAEGQEAEVKVPDIGTDEQVEVIEISVAEGDSVEQEQTILVLESDKATMEIPVPEAGKITALLVKQGDKVATGDVIAKMRHSGGAQDEGRSDDDSQKSSPEKNDTKSEQSKPEKPATSEQTSAPQKKQQSPSAASEQSSSRAHAGPAVRKLARELGLDLALVEGSGRKGRVLKDDVKAYVKSRLSGDAAPGGAAMIQEAPLPDFSQFGDTEVVPMDKMQKVTAQNMQRCWATIPHVTQFDHADITEMEAFRKAKKGEAERLGVKLTPLPFILKACAHALQKYPQFNVSIDMQSQSIVRKKYLNIGMAVDTPAGLVVPVIKDVDRKSIWELAEECISLAGMARDRKLKPADMQGGCFTVSSLGSIGGTAFTPIVNAPEVAILGVSKAEYQPRYNGTEFEPRLMLPLSLSYDHRAVNGVDGAQFCAHIARVLSDLRELLL